MRPHFFGSRDMLLSIEQYASGWVRAGASTSRQSIRLSGGLQAWTCGAYAAHGPEISLDLTGKRWTFSGARVIIVKCADLEGVNVNPAPIKSLRRPGASKADASRCGQSLESRNREKDAG